jgi:uncharacterized cupin superfamily protein
MASIEKKSIKSPDETRQFQGKGQAAVVNVGGLTVGLGTFEPGWRWSENVKPIAKTDSCQTSHKTYVISGRMHVKHNDGTEVDLGPGDVASIAPGHDAWIVGNEPCVALEFGSAATYARTT